MRVKFRLLHGSTRGCHRPDPHPTREKPVPARRVRVNTQVGDKAAVGIPFAGIPDGYSVFVVALVALAWTPCRRRRRHRLAMAFAMSVSSVALVLVVGRARVLRWEVVEVMVAVVVIVSV